jgi:HNH endonuclease
MPHPHIPSALRRLVGERAYGCCEYCLIPQTVGASMHHLDHLVALKHGGATVDANLALACIDCNLGKGSDLAAIDPVERVVVLLFNPRTQRWGDHFQLVGPRIVGRIPTGRATVALLRLNDEARLIDRQMLIEARRYPPLHMQEAPNMEAE